MTKAAKRTFHSLRYRNYRLFFGGQIVSQTGSWMQRIALGWYVLQLTHSPFDVGVMAFAQFLPYMVFGLFAGVLADRLDARRTVIATQAAQLDRRRRRSPGSRSAASRSRGCSTRSPSSTGRCSCSTCRRASS